MSVGWEGACFGGLVSLRGVKLGERYEALRSGCARMIMDRVGGVSGVGKGHDYGNDYMDGYA